MVVVVVVVVAEIAQRRSAADECSAAGGAVAVVNAVTSNSRSVFDRVIFCMKQLASVSLVFSREEVS